MKKMTMTTAIMTAAPCTIASDDEVEPETLSEEEEEEQGAGQQRRGQGTKRKRFVFRFDDGMVCRQTALSLSL